MLARATSMIVDDDDDGGARSAIARDGNGFAVEFVEREERGETTFEGVLVGCANPARARNERQTCRFRKMLTRLKRSAR